jgi:hypothetical protein
MRTNMGQRRLDFNLEAMDLDYARKQGEVTTAERIRQREDLERKYADLLPPFARKPSTSYGTVGGSGFAWWMWWIALWLFIDLVAVGTTLIYLWTGKWGIY